MRHEKLINLRDPAGKAALKAIVELSEGIQSDDADYDWDVNIRRHKWRLAVDLKLCRAFFEPGSRILEIGSSPPHLNAALKNEGSSIAGVDLEPERFSEASARLGLDIRKVDIERERLPFADDSFQGVLMNEVFEHLRIDPIHAVGETFRVLAPGHRMMLSTPSLLSSRAFSNLIRTRKLYAVAGSVYVQYQKLSKYGMMGHVREYCPADVEDFVIRTGFRVVQRICRRKGSFFERLICRAIPALSSIVTFVLEKPY